jgi:phosphoglycerate dehydrogenase-like enzyme
MAKQPPPRIAVLDDYQRVARKIADWSAVDKRARVTVFDDHLDKPADVVKRLKPFAAVCVMRERTPLTAEILRQLPNLKMISSTGPRNASIDLAAAHELGITVCNTGYKAHGASEATWALILGLVRAIPAEVNSVRAGGWQVAVGGDLERRTLGLLGLGRLGVRVAKVGLAFGMNAIAWSQNLTQETAAAAGVKLVDKDTLFRQSDILTVHLVLSARTRGLVGARELGLMKPTALLVNTSRGPIVDEKALVAALRKKQIAGAALDVFDTEPLPEKHPLRRLDNVLATPHIGFVTRETYETFLGDTVENLIAWLDGKPVRVASA